MMFTCEVDGFRYIYLYIDEELAKGQPKRNWVKERVVDRE